MVDGLFPSIGLRSFNIAVALNVAFGFLRALGSTFVFDANRGPKRAISKVAGWINEKFFSPEVLSAIAPIAGQAALDTF
ncbi:hypothetical protein BJP08_00180 [Corynebacterium sp. NML140438]|nr:hypothetical protein BJP08_00180 [Corynebacterium sp. NML140438]